MGTVLAKQAQAAMASGSAPPTDSPLGLVSWHRLRHSMKEGWSDLLRPLLFKCPSSVVCAVIALITSLPFRL